MRDHLEQVEKATGKIPEQLFCEELPFDSAHIWETYFDLRQAQKVGEAITFSEIKAYCELTGIRLSGFELRCIRNLDAAFLRTRNG